MECTIMSKKQKAECTAFISALLKERDVETINYYADRLCDGTIRYKRMMTRTQASDPDLGNIVRQIHGVYPGIKIHVHWPAPGIGFWPGLVWYIKTSE